MIDLVRLQICESHTELNYICPSINKYLQRAYRLYFSWRIKKNSSDLSTLFHVVYQLYSLSEQKLYFPQKKVFRCTCTAQSSESLHFSNLSTESWIQGRHHQLSTECWSSSWGARLNCDYSGWEKYSWGLKGNTVCVHREIHLIREEKYSWSAGAT